MDERANFIAEALAREPTDEDVRGELRRALEAKRENEALRDHIEHLKTGELDQGLEASKRMAEMSSEFMARVEELTRERDASRARVDAAEREAREFAAYMRERGFGAAPASATPAAPHDGDVSIGDDGIDAAPAATLFASPLDPGLDRDPSDYIATPVAPESVLDASFDFGGASNGVSHASSDASSLDPKTLPRGRRSRRPLARVQSVHDAVRRGGRGRGARGDGEHGPSHARRRGLEPRRGERAPRARTPRAGRQVGETPARSERDAAARERLPRPGRRKRRPDAPRVAAGVLRPGGYAEASSSRPEVTRRLRSTRTSVARIGWRTRGPPRGKPRRRVPAAPPSSAWEMLGTAAAAAQMTDALERAARAANEAAALLADGGDESGGGSVSAGGFSTSAVVGTPGGTLEKALRRMRRKGHAIAGAGPTEQERRARALEAAREAAQAAALAGMQRTRLVEMLEEERARSRRDAERARATPRRREERSRRRRKKARSRLPPPRPWVPVPTPPRRSSRPPRCPFPTRRRV